MAHASRSTAATASTADAYQFGINDEIYLDGGTQLVENGLGNPLVIFDTGDATPDNSWTITTAANPNAQDANALLATFNGMNAGYDGIATLGGVGEIEMGGADYTLNVMAAGGSYTDMGATLDVDMGGDTITFQAYGTSYWHVNGAGDTAVLDGTAIDGITASPVELYFTGAMAQYALGFDAAGDVTVTGGTTGTTTIETEGGRRRA